MSRSGVTYEDIGVRRLVSWRLKRPESTVRGCGSCCVLHWSISEDAASLPSAPPAVVPHGIVAKPKWAAAPSGVPVPMPARPPRCFLSVRHCLSSGLAKSLDQGILRLLDVCLNLRSRKLMVEQVHFCPSRGNVKCGPSAGESVQQCNEHSDRVPCRRTFLFLLSQCSGQDWLPLVWQSTKSWILLRSLQSAVSCHVDLLRQDQEGAHGQYCTGVPYGQTQNVFHYAPKKART